MLLAEDPARSRGLADHRRGRRVTGQLVSADGGFSS